LDYNLTVKGLFLESQLFCQSCSLNVKWLNATSVINEGYVDVRLSLTCNYIPCCFRVLISARVRQPSASTVAHLDSSLIHSPLQFPPHRLSSPIAGI